MSVSKRFGIVVCREARMGFVRSFLLDCRTAVIIRFLCHCNRYGYSQGQQFNSGECCLLWMLAFQTDVWWNVVETVSLANGCYIHSVINQTRPSTTFFHISKVRFRWVSIKCFHDNSPVFLVEVEFVMEAFDWRPPKFYFEIWKARVTDNCCNLPKVTFW